MHQNLIFFSECLSLNYRDEVLVKRLVRMNEDVMVYCVIYRSNKRPKQQHE